MNHCPSAESLELLLSDQLSHVDRDTIVAHVEDCTLCQEQLERLVAESETVVAPVHCESPEPALATEFLNRLNQISPPGWTGSVREARGRIAVAKRPRSDDSSAVDSVNRFEGRRLGQYEILEKLGKGGMGVVYRALHVELGKVVALKVLPEELMHEISIARFRNEIRAIGKLDHPNIVGTHDAGHVQGIHFLVMAFVDGTDLAELVQRRGRLPVPDACEVIRQAAIGLQHAFDRGLVHRDVKPSNLMLTRDGQVKVLDLGIARSLGEEPVVERLTATGWFLGTADYLAPEQWENPHAVGTQADIYSLGCTLYHLLAGHPPFAGRQYNSLPKKMRAHQEAPVPPIMEIRPDAPAQLAAVLDRMLAKNPADRFSTPGDAAEALRPLAAQSNLTALTESDGLAADHPKARSDSAGETVPPTSTPVYGGTVHTRRVRSRDVLRRYRLPLALLSLCMMLGASLTLLPGRPGPLSPQEPLKISRMSILQYRGDAAEPQGDVTATFQDIRQDDTVVVSAKLSRPAYCYLIAFNPDGTEQLCYPEDPALPAVNYPDHKDLARAMAVPPERTQELLFPQEQFFEPGMSGLQTFVLVASTQPLPAYAKWRSQVGRIPWSPPAYHQPWRWHFDGQAFIRLPAQRGQRVQRGAPNELKALCGFFQSRPKLEAIQALAFPVTHP